MTKEVISILGDGGWGTALALLVFENGHEARLWSNFPDYAAEVRSTRENRKFLPGIAIPPEILVTSDAGEALSGSTLAIVAVPTQFIRATLAPLKGAFAVQRVVSVAKGLENHTLAPGDRSPRSSRSTSACPTATSQSSSVLLLLEKVGGSTTARS